MRLLREVRPGTSPVLAGEPFARQAELFVSAPVGWGGDGSHSTVLRYGEAAAASAELENTVAAMRDAELSFGPPRLLSLDTAALSTAAAAAARAAAASSDGLPIERVKVRRCRLTPG